MNELYEKSLHKLELDKVLCLLADQACSASGKEQCLKTQPLSDADEIRLLQKQTSARLPHDYPQRFARSCRGK